LKNFFYSRERERESEFTQGFEGEMEGLSLMGVILPYWGRVRQGGIAARIGLVGLFLCPNMLYSSYGQ